MSFAPNRSGPFHRSMLIASLVAAALSLTSLAQQQQALAAIPPYESRGKRKSKGSGGNRKAPGAQMAFIRKARKARNK